MDNSWKKWEGGDRPYEPNIEVEVQFRNGKIERGFSAFTMWWHEDSPWDIVAYRIHIQKPKGETE